MSIEVRPSLDALQALDWGKGDGLLPAVVQDADTLQVLMLGYVSAESLAATLAIGHMTFFSRSKQRLWTKGEQSGNVLVVQSIRGDCDAAGDGAPGRADLPHRCRELFRPGAEGFPGWAGPAGGHA